VQRLVEEKLSRLCDVVSEWKPGEDMHECSCVKQGEEVRLICGTMHSEKWKDDHQICKKMEKGRERCYRAAK